MQFGQWVMERITSLFRIVGLKIHGTGRDAAQAQVTTKATIALLSMEESRLPFSTMDAMVPGTWWFMGMISIGTSVARGTQMAQVSSREWRVMCKARASLEFHHHSKSHAVVMRAPQIQEF